jgi:DNA-directed RNA polymerase specialized sigma24 family protein
MWMTTEHGEEAAAARELDAIATATQDRLRAEAEDNRDAAAQARQRVQHAAGAAITAGARLSAVADAERAGEERAREALRSELLRQVTRAAKRMREAARDYEVAIRRAGRVGLSHREIASAAEVTHGTVRAVLGRAPGSDGLPAQTVDAPGVDAALG